MLDLPNNYWQYVNHSSWASVNVVASAHNSVVIRQLSLYNQRKEEDFR